MRPADPKACRRLWRCVLIRVVLDLCENADVDPDRIHAELKRLLPLSPRERAAEIKARRHGNGALEMLDAA